MPARQASSIWRREPALCFTGPAPTCGGWAALRPPFVCCLLVRPGIATWSSPGGIWADGRVADLYVSRSRTSWPETPTRPTTSSRGWLAKRVVRISVSRKGRRPTRIVAARGFRLTDGLRPLVHRRPIWSPAIPTGEMTSSFAVHYRGFPADSPESDVYQARASRRSLHYENRRTYVRVPSRVMPTYRVAFTDPPADLLERLKPKLVGQGDPPSSFSRPRPASSCQRSRCGVPSSLARMPGPRGRLAGLAGEARLLMGPKPLRASAL